MTTAIITGAASGMGRACIDPVRPLVDVVVAVDLHAPDIDGTVGVACDISDPAAVSALVTQVRDTGPFRALVHAAGISPTMADPRRVFEVDLVGTQLLLDAFESLVDRGSAAVCFSSSAAYEVAPYVDGEQEAMLDDPLAADFLDRATSVVSDSGYAYSLAKVGVIRAAARAAVRWGRRGGRVNSIAPGLIDTPMQRQERDEHPDHPRDVRADAARALGRAARGGRRCGVPRLGCRLVRVRHRCARRRRDGARPGCGNLSIELTSARRSPWLLLQK